MDRVSSQEEASVFRTNLEEVRESVEEAKAGLGNHSLRLSLRQIESGQAGANHRISVAAVRVHL